jgi:exosortase/archaeosortase
MSADQTFAILTVVAWPATMLFPVIYGITTPWWRSWIGRALMTDAIGVFTLVTLSVIVQWFGTDYWGRDFFRIAGMAVAALGFWLILFALVRVKVEVRHELLDSEKG